MSIVSSICADNDNKLKDKWVEKLAVAIENKSWEEVEKIKSEMEEFYFSE